MAVLGKDGVDHTTTDRDTATAIGMPYTNGEKVRASSKTLEIQATMAENDIQSEHLNARQCFEFIKAVKVPRICLHRIPASKHLTT